MDAPAAELDEREDVERPEPGGLDREEVAGDDAVRLRPEELGPGGTAPAWSGAEARSPESKDRIVVAPTRIPSLRNSP